MIRLDKWLAESGIGSRKEVKTILKKGRCRVNEVVEKDPGRKVNPDEDYVWVDGKPVVYEAYVYYMLHKPQGVISATEDPKHRTVLDLIHSSDQRRGLYPVGRLDKDTEGLLLITNDGALGHDLLSPKHHVEKTYEAVIDGPLTPEMGKAFTKGIELVGEDLTKPAKLSFLWGEDDGPRVEVVITEGKFHQIKRMFHAVGREVLYLKRTQMGALKLDPKLELGMYRRLTSDEVTLLKNLSRLNGQ